MIFCNFKNRRLKCSIVWGHKMANLRMRVFSIQNRGFIIQTIKKFMIQKLKMSKIVNAKSKIQKTIQK